VEDNVEFKIKLSLKNLHFVGLQARHKTLKKWALDVCDPTLTVLAPENYFLHELDFRANFP
jgi:hypothetical protein